MNRHMYLKSGASIYQVFANDIFPDRNRTFKATNFEVYTSLSNGGGEEGEGEMQYEEKPPVLENHFEQSNEADPSLENKMNWNLIDHENQSLLQNMQVAQEVINTSEHTSSIFDETPRPISNQGEQSMLKTFAKTQSQQYNVEDPAVSHDDISFSHFLMHLSYIYRSRLLH